MRLPLHRLYRLVAAGRSDDAVKYFFGVTPCDLLLRDADVGQLNAQVLVAILLGTRVQKSQLPSRVAFAARAKSRLFELLPEERVTKLWERIG